MYCNNSSWINICSDSIYHCNFNCNLDGTSLPNPLGCFSYGCDGVERLIYTSTIPHQSLQFNVKNTGACPFKVSLTQVVLDTTTTLNYNVDPGQPLSISSNNINNIYITCTSDGIFKYCNYSSCNNCYKGCSNCSNIGCKTCSGNYTIIT